VPVPPRPPPTAGEGRQLRPTARLHLHQAEAEAGPVGGLHGRVPQPPSDRRTGHRRQADTLAEPLRRAVRLRGPQEGATARRRAVR
ncbi:hypothetical protein ABTM91_20565, partial [Acinetobacter baumannii]